MSNSNGTQTLVKSMNGILSFDTGGGVVISGDTIVAGNIDLQNLNIDNIQGIAPADNITLYTNTTGNINTGSYSTNLNTVRGNNTTLSSSLLTQIDSGTKVNISSPTLDLVVSGKVNIGGGQDIEPLVLSNGLKIGNDITSSNLLLGNATYPPSCTATATTANHICNYSTVQALVAGGGGSILSSNNTFTGSNTFTQPLLCDSYQPTANV